MMSDIGSVQRGWLPSGRCSVFACDIISFGAQNRVNHIQRFLRSELYGRLDRGFTDAGIPFHGCYTEDRGDGTIVIPQPDVPTTTMISPLIERLDAEFRRQNEVASTVATIRLRIALHSGEVEFDGHGIVGNAVNHTFRLLEAPSFKTIVANQGPRLALIVSQHLHDEIIRHGEGLIDPSHYERLAVVSKETDTSGWIRLLGAVSAAHDHLPAQDHLPSKSERQPRPASTPGPPEPAGADRHEQPGADARPDELLGAGLRIPSRVIFAISEQLLDLPVMTTTEGRNRIIGALPDDIARTTPRQTEARLDAYSLVQTCIDHPGGLRELIAILRGFAGPSESLRRLEEMTNRLLRHPPSSQ